CNPDNHLNRLRILHQKIGRASSRNRLLCALTLHIENIKDDRPIGLHRNTIIFGFVLLYDETSDSFIWLFDTFVKDMDFSADFSSCIYDHDHEKDFLNAWDTIIINLAEEDLKKRALVYGRDTFCADMMSTQRSESMNKVMKHYTWFFEHFQRLLDDRRYDEMIADFKANHSKVALFMPIEILKHAASVYAPEVFKLFQANLDCLIETSCGGENGEGEKYTIRHVKKLSSSIVSYEAGRELIS
ncbi:hypothetical protein V2J09_009265, partial [Rumex salicifolius]